MRRCESRRHLLEGGIGLEDLDAEVDRLSDLGAQRLAEHNEDGFHTVVLADPLGNEFCVVQR